MEVWGFAAVAARLGKANGAYRAGRSYSWLSVKWNLTNSNPDKLIEVTLPRLEKANIDVDSPKWPWVFPGPLFCGPEVSLW